VCGTIVPIYRGASYNDPALELPRRVVGNNNEKGTDRALSMTLWPDTSVGEIASFAVRHAFVDVPEQQTAFFVGIGTAHIAPDGEVAAVKLATIRYIFVPKYLQRTQAQDAFEIVAVRNKQFNTPLGWLPYNLGSPLFVEILGKTDVGAEQRFDELREEHQTQSKQVDPDRRSSQHPVTTSSTITAPAVASEPKQVSS